MNASGPIDPEDSFVHTDLGLSRVRVRRALAVLGLTVGLVFGVVMLAPRPASPVVSTAPARGAAPGAPALASR